MIFKNFQYYRSGFLIKETAFFIYLILILFIYSGISKAEFVFQPSNAKSLTDNPTKLNFYVVDETGTLTDSEKKQLLTKLVDFEKQTTNQVLVYMISSLNGEPIEDVTIRIAEKNKIGRKDRNNGVLFLIAKNDRKMRIEVGYGLEGVLTDALTKSIQDNIVRPEFRNNNYYSGIDKGIDAIISASKGEYKADDPGKKGNNIFSWCPFPVFFMILFFVIFFIIISSICRKFRGGGRGGLGGFWAGGSGWSGGSSGWSSGGSSFGGFSGGGGSFGGGGSSGSW